MTAVVVIVQPHAAHVLSDGALCADGPDGVAGRQAVGLSHKIHAMPAHAAIYLGRGPTVLTMGMRTALDAHDGFDAMVEALPTLARQIESALRHMLPAGEHPADYVVAGWSVRHDRFMCCVLPTHDHHGLSHPAFEVFEATVLGAAAQEVSLDLDPDTDGLRMLREQRQIDPIGVGGFAQIMTVYRDRIETRILERWDAPGDRLAA